MSRWDHLGKQHKKEPDFDQVPVEGNFQCGTCYESVDTAVYIPQDFILTFKCSNGHKTFLDKVRL